LKMPIQLYRNLGSGRFEDVSPKAGPAFQREDVSRGAAFGDVDNDGDQDVVLGVAAGRTRLLLNTVGNARRWVGLRLIGRAVKRDMLGARVGIVAADGRTLWRRVRADGSYASANDPRVLVGLGPMGPAAVRVRVQWPDGSDEQWASVATGRWSTLTQGGGQATTPVGAAP
ncbi:MAG TPA: CRTAC1 family protein, partial [Vicinamibacterales bacterium]